MPQHAYDTRHAVSDTEVDDPMGECCATCFRQKTRGSQPPDAGLVSNCSCLEMRQYSFREAIISRTRTCCSVHTCPRKPTDKIKSLIPLGYVQILPDRRVEM